MVFSKIIESPGLWSTLLMNLNAPCVILEAVDHNAGAINVKHKISNKFKGACDAPFTLLNINKIKKPTTAINKRNPFNGSIFCINSVKAGLSKIFNNFKRFPITPYKPSNSHAPPCAIFNPNGRKKSPAGFPCVK